MLPPQEIVLSFPGNLKLHLLPEAKQEQHINEGSPLHSYEHQQWPHILSRMPAHFLMLFVCFQCSRKAA